MTATNIVAACLGVAILITIGVFVWQFTNLRPDALSADALDGSAS
ncbi:MAG TPA: hypothetical protein VGX03_11095 [Candidatus Binatia bacterium]|jgi:hypothetical protein|nr:hypothetical protein [Candidatus Binatia bacterium]